MWQIGVSNQGVINFYGTVSPTWVNFRPKNNTQACTFFSKLSQNRSVILANFKSLAGSSIVLGENVTSLEVVGSSAATNTLVLQNVNITKIGGGEVILDGHDQTLDISGIPVNFCLHRDAKFFLSLFCGEAACTKVVAALPQQKKLRAIFMYMVVDRRNLSQKIFCFLLDNTIKFIMHLYAQFFCCCVTISGEATIQNECGIIAKIIEKVWDLCA